MNSNVPRPFINRTTAGLMPNRKGTRTVAPNIANICCKLKGSSSEKGTFSSTCMILLVSKFKTSLYISISIKYSLESITQKRKFTKALYMLK
jgi:hypothetical protein